MVLYMIGLGLSSEKDISILGLETIKKCDFLYLETYTSILYCSIEDLEKFYGKKINVADRDLVENRADEILDKAKEFNVGFLVIGDPFCATTHSALRLRAKEAHIPVQVIHNSSIVSAIGVIGLEVYKYGKTTSIPLRNENIRTPVEVFEINQKSGFHTLFLLDLEPKNGQFLTIKDTCIYLISNGISEEKLSIGCSGIGSGKQVIKAGSLKEIMNLDYKDPPYCLVIPGKLHFMEEDSLKLWKES